MLSVGIAGCGYWGSKHVRVLSSMAGVREVVAIDPDELRVKQMAMQFPTVRTERSLAKALSTIDAVIIATPAGSHFELAMKAIDAGVSVLVEKPLATSSDEAERLCRAAERAGVVLMVGHTFEYNAVVTELRDLIASGDLGEVYYLDTARLNLGLYQSDVNVVWDLAPHDISIATYVLDAEPTSVRAWGWRHANHNQEDRATLQIQYGSVSAQVNVSWLSPNKVRRVIAVGSKKMAVYDDLNTDERLRVYDKGVEVEPGTGTGYPMQYRYGAIMSPYIEFSEPLQVEDRHFLDCVQNRSRPRSDGWSGLSVVRAIEAANLSMSIDRPIDLERLRPALSA